MGQEQSTPSVETQNHDIFQWLGQFQLSTESKTDGKKCKTKAEFPSFDDHIRTIRAVKNLCEPSKKAQKPGKLALTIAKLPPLLREDALGYLTQHERQRVLDSFEKYFTLMFHNRLALMRKYQEEVNQAERRQERIDKNGHVLADAFYEVKVTNYWEIFRDDSFNSFGLSQVHPCCCTCHPSY